MSIKVKVIMTLLAGLLLALSFGAGCAPDRQTPTGKAQGLEVIEQAWKIIFDDYVDKDKLDVEALSQAAIKGMLEALNDPHTAYIDTETYQLGMGSYKGKIEGIGAQVAVRDEQIIIVAPIPDSPAAQAGIRAGDIILGINGQPASGMSLAEAVLKIRGPKGTSVSLLILHQDETNAEEIEIVRDEINVPSIHFQMREDIAYIRITHFSERTDEELSSVLEGIARRSVTGIILDLRSNPGGILEVVIDVTSHFLKDGVVVDVVDNKGKHTVSRVKPGGLTTELPMVVLVDSFTASGGEVLAGALQDHGRATIAGTTTFGKGSVNILRQLQDGSGLYITTARWFTPNGRPIEGKGLAPDIELKLTDEEAIQWAINYLKGGNK